MTKDFPDIPDFLRVVSYDDKTTTYADGSVHVKTNKPVVQQPKKVEPDIPLNRRKTEEKIYRMLCEIITPESKRTKGALIKYVRDNFKEPTIYADVGRVASKIIKTHTTGRFAQWGFVTTARHVRAI